MGCFPFLEGGERLRFGDGTIYSAGRLQTPPFLSRDNPAVRVLFVVRDPVARTASHHRFMYASLARRGGAAGGEGGNLNEMVALLLGDGRGGAEEAALLPFVQMRALAAAALAAPDPNEKLALVLELTAIYLRGAARQTQDLTYRRFAPLLAQSLYFPAVYHWFASVPRGQVSVGVAVAVAVEISFRQRSSRTRRRAVTAHHSRALLPSFPSLFLLLPPSSLFHPSLFHSSFPPSSLFHPSFSCHAQIKVLVGEDLANPPAEVVSEEVS